MASYRSHEDRQPAVNVRVAPHQRRNDRDDRFYDDHRSRSRSRGRRYNSPPRGRTPSYDSSRTPPRGPAADGRDEYRYEKDWDRSYRQSNRGYRNEDRSPPSPRRGRVSYRDRDREGYRSPSYESRSRSRGRSSRDGQSRRYTAPPNKEVMMEGLAADMTEEDITLELKQHYQVDGLTDVRVIRDRQTRQSRQFGFLRFASLSLAQSFMERNNQSLYLYGNPNINREEPTKVRIVYSRERNDANEAEGEWVCKVCSVNNYATRMRCFRCQAFRADAPNIAAQKASNIGDNDASPDHTPSQFLLFRGLEPSVTEDLLVKGVAKLNKPAIGNSFNQSSNKKGAKVASTTGDSNLGAKQGTLRRVLLVRDRRTNESWRFGFAEYGSVEDAMAALTRYNSFDKFTIASKPVLVSYVHSGVFVPVLNTQGVDPRFVFSPLANPSMKIAYWDDEAFVAEYRVLDADNEPQQGKSREEVAKAAAETSEITKSKKRKAEPSAVDISTAKKATPSYLQRWSNQHAELHGLDAKPLDQGERPPAKTESHVSSEVSPGPPTQSFADTKRNCCYLCSRQFKTAAEVNKHERLSNLHQENLKSEELVTRANAKLEKHGIPPTRQSHAPSQTTTTTEYRDRAKERRKAFGVVNKKGQAVPPSKSSRSTTGLEAPGQDDSDDADSAAQTASKGASLMGKMGYKASSGLGLGATGSGMTAPIRQDVYVAGVGLGAQGGKLGDAVQEAERNTRGDYGGFLERTREGARERFERLG